MVKVIQTGIKPLTLVVFIIRSTSEQIDLHPSEHKPMLYFINHPSSILSLECWLCKRSLHSCPSWVNVSCKRFWHLHPRLMNATYSRQPTCTASSDGMWQLIRWLNVTYAKSSADLVNTNPGMEECFLIKSSAHKNMCSLTLNALYYTTPHHTNCSPKPQNPSSINDFNLRYFEGSGSFSFILCLLVKIDIR